MSDDPADDLKKELGQMIRAAMNIVALLYQRGHNHTSAAVQHSTTGMSNGGRAAKRKVRGLSQLAAARARRANRKARQKGRPPIRKLSPVQRRKARQQMAEQIGMERMARSWYAMRVDSYHDARLAHQKSQQRWWAPEYSAADERAEHNRLLGLRHGIEASMQRSALSPEQRGQVSLALGQIDHNPSGAYRHTVFRDMDQHGAAQARAAAERSAQWVADWDASRTNGSGPSHRTSPHAGVSLTRAPATTTGRAAVESMSWDQLQAVQKIRRTQMAWAREPRGWEGARQIAAEEGIAAGLTRQQVRQEFGNTHLNSVAHTTISSRAGQSSSTEVGYFATTTEAAAYAHRYIGRVTWSAGTALRVEARQAGREQANFVASGGERSVTGAVSKWLAGFTQAANGNGNHHSAAHPRTVGAAANATNGAPSRARGKRAPSRSRS